jgi:thioesterase domain-containing protein
MQMLLEVEALLGYQISKSDVAEATTIHQLAAIPATGVRDGDDELVTKAKGGAGRPFFFCHGDFETHGFYAVKLAALLEPDQPVYLLHPLLDVTEKSELVIEDMARVYVSRLIALQPHGSFQLGGFCNGGLLAWEIAHQLVRAGREIELVVLVDSFSLNSRPLFRTLHRVLQGMASLTLPKDLQRILRREAMPAVWKWTRESEGSAYQWIVLAVQSFNQRLARANSAARPSTSLFDWRNVLYFRAMANYIPPKLDCDLIAVACEHNANTFEWSTEPWTRLASTVRHIIVPGEHRTCITKHVEALAQSLNVNLNEFNATPALSP